jgi:hypothetical protein
MIDLKQLNEFAGIEAENFDQFKEQFQTKFVLKENVVKDPDLTSAITGKVMGSQMTKIRQMFKEEGIEITEEETKTIKKNEELFQLGMNKLKGSYINQLEDVKKSSALGSDERLREYETRIQKIEKEKNDIKSAWKSTGEEFEKYKSDISASMKQKEIDYKVSKAKESLKLRAKINEAERAGFESILKNRLKFDMDDSGSLVIMNGNGERIKSKVKAGDFMPAEEAMQEIVNELGLGESNPHAGKPAPQVPLTNQGFGLGNRNPRPMPNQQAPAMSAGKRIHPRASK